MNRWCLILCLGLSTLARGLAADPAALVTFDFANTQPAPGWRAAHDITRLEPGPEGMILHTTGNDPYLFSPSFNTPANQPLWVQVELRSDVGGEGQIYFFPNPGSASEERVRRFVARPGIWERITLPLPALGDDWRLRVDPPGEGARTILRSVRLLPRAVVRPPAWPEPVPMPILPQTPRLRAGQLELTILPFGFAADVAGTNFALSHNRPLAGYVANGTNHWLNLAAAAENASVEPDGDGWVARVQSRDPDGATWTLTRRFLPVEAADTILIDTTLRVDQARDILHVPLLLLLPGRGSFGPAKRQGLFAGLEYLDDEPSSSEADIIGPESHRQTPAPHKVTFPLMALQTERRYLALTWEVGPEIQPFFDSPDRTFRAGGHALGLFAPGFASGLRMEGDIVAQRPVTLPAGGEWRARAWLLGGTGRSAVDAVRHYIRVRGIPDLPSHRYTREDFVNLESRSWLDSRVREGRLYRHAAWPGFNAQPAADAALHQLWLAGLTADPGLADRLRAASTNALAAVLPGELASATIGHVRTPAPALTFGPVLPSIDTAMNRARGLTGAFDADGTIRSKAGKVDYGRTHFATHANGLTAPAVQQLLAAAAWSGDPELRREGLARLRGMDRYRLGVPRGAQTWEVPLHTPDILAAAHLVNAYVLGYQLSGEKRFLDEAAYWAWTGVPFVYLHDPVAGPVGRYNTIAVLGATGWQAPVWFGRPVQWCGLVYADALYHLARLDASGPWEQLARGITVGGLQHTWPAGDTNRLGLLPDYFELPAQLRSGPAINPFTLGVNAARYFSTAEQPLDLYDRVGLPERGWMLHAPARLELRAGDTNAVEFQVGGWPPGTYHVLVTGPQQQPALGVSGSGTAAVAAWAPRRLVLKVTGRPVIRLTE